MSDFPFSIPRRGDADVVNGVSYAGTTLTLTRAEGSDLTTTIATSDPTKIENGDSSMEIDTANGDCVFTPNGNAALATTFETDGKFNVNQQIRFNDLNGIGHAINFLALPNIQVGSAYMIANTNIGATFQRLLSYTKIGNMLNINGYFIFTPTATTGTAYMNYSEIGLAGAIDNAVYIISDLGNGFFTSITHDTGTSRLLFTFTVGSGAVNVVQYASIKFLFGCSFRSSYG